MTDYELQDEFMTQMYGLDTEQWWKWLETWLEPDIARDLLQGALEEYMLNFWEDEEYAEAMPKLMKFIEDMSIKPKT